VKLTLLPTMPSIMSYLPRTNILIPTSLIDPGALCFQHTNYSNLPLVPRLVLHIKLSTVIPFPLVASTQPSHDVSLEPDYHFGDVTMALFLSNHYSLLIPKDRCITIRETYALQISFPIPPSTGSSVSFSWIREPEDKSELWLRKQLLQDPRRGGAPTPLTGPVPVYLDDKQKGNSTLFFNSSG